MFLRTLFSAFLVSLPLCGFTQSPNLQKEVAKAVHGVTVNISGWSFGNNKITKDELGGEGKIVYQLRVDNGNIVSARPLQQTVSPSVESFYRQQILRLKLSPKGSIAPSDLTTGTLTVNISDSQSLQVTGDNPNVIQSSLNQDTTGKSSSAIYLSVLRYRGKVIDISPIGRDYSGEEDYSRTVHKSSRSSLDPSDALEMVSNYGWQVTGSKLYKSYSSYNQKDPSFISRTIELIRLK
ncbi:hypothetical protein [Fibrella aestuarina]|uniref:hypothetical protein n=1 Tax=Fibrella aestuarina TaxID=651143 RepID=UPI0011D239B3|nr:hypothetical protein [Fibrella aestuarina]